MPDDLFVNPNIETALEDSIRSQVREPSTREYYYASGMGMCVRKQIAERAGLTPTNPPDARGLFKMGVGTVVGKWVQERLEATGYLDPTWHEKRVTYRSYVGKVDGYTTRVNGGAVVEVKTCDDDAITRYKDLPQHYLWQGLFYCLASGVNWLVVFQIGKNQGLTKHRVVFLDEKWKGLLEDEISRMEKAWGRYAASRELPPCEHKFPWEDKLCSFREADDVQQLVGGQKHE